MAYPKTRITRSRSRNMRKKQLVKSKSKRINRSRKSNKNHSRKYRGGDSAVSAEYIQAIIRHKTDAELTLEKNTNFPKVSIEGTSSKIKDFLTNNERGTLIALGYAGGGTLKQWLYRSPDNEHFLVYEYTTGEKSPDVYYLQLWMLAAIYVEERRIKEGRKGDEERRILEEEEEERRILEEESWLNFEALRRFREERMVTWVNNRYNDERRTQNYNEQVRIAQEERISDAVNSMYIDKGINLNDEEKKRIIRYYENRLDHKRK